MVLVVSASYMRYVSERHFTIAANISCGAHENAPCFISDDPSSIGVDGPYKKVYIPASDAPACLEEHGCEQFSCPRGVACDIEYCNEGTVEIGETCATSSPEQSP